MFDHKSHGLCRCGLPAATSLSSCGGIPASIRVRPKAMWDTLCSLISVQISSWFSVFARGSVVAVVLANPSLLIIVSVLAYNWLRILNQTSLIVINVLEAITRATDPNQPTNMLEGLYRVLSMPLVFLFWLFSMPLTMTETIATGIVRAIVFMMLTLWSLYSDTEPMSADTPPFLAVTQSHRPNQDAPLAPPTATPHTTTQRVPTSRRDSGLPPSSCLGQTASGTRCQQRLYYTNANMGFCKKHIEQALNRIAT